MWEGFRWIVQVGVDRAVVEVGGVSGDQVLGHWGGWVASC